MTRGSATTRAAVVTQPGTTEVRRLALPDDLGGGALLRIEAAAVCGTDRVHYLDADFLARGPLVLGHENVGTIVAIEPVAEAAWQVGVGTRVIVDEMLPCGRCPACRDGHGHRCPHTDFRSPRALRYGRTPLARQPGLWGGFAEHLYLDPRAVCHPLPDDLGAPEATFAHPLANGLRWLGAVARLSAGERVLIVGPGAHGLGCTLAARALGAGHVTVAGLHHDSRRLRDAVTLGADTTVVIEDPTQPLANLRRTADVTPFDVVVDLTPMSDEVLAAALEVAAPGGRVVLAGHKGARSSALLADHILRKELTLLGVRGSDVASLRAAVDVVDRHRDQVAAVSSRVFALDEVDTALRTIGAPGAPAHLAVTA